MNSDLCLPRSNATNQYAVERCRAGRGENWKTNPLKSQIEFTIPTHVIFFQAQHTCHLLLCQENCFQTRIDWFQTRMESISGFFNWFKSTSADKPMMEDGGGGWFPWPIKLGQGCVGCCLYIFYWIVIIRKIRNWRESWSRTGEWLRISGGEWVAELTSLWMTISFN